MDWIVDNMSAAGLVRTVELTSRNSEQDCLFDQVFNAYYSIISSGAVKVIQFPEDPRERLFPDMSSSMHEQPQGVIPVVSQQDRVRYSPFQLIKIGNHAQGTVRLSIDRVPNTAAQFTYKAFKKHLAKDHLFHSTAREKYGLFIPISTSVFNSMTSVNSDYTLSSHAWCSAHWTWTSGWSTRLPSVLQRSGCIHVLQSQDLAEGPVPLDFYSR